MSQNACSYCGTETLPLAGGYVQSTEKPSSGSLAQVAWACRGCIQQLDLPWTRVVPDPSRAKGWSVERVWRDPKTGEPL